MGTKKRNAVSGVYTIAYMSHNIHMESINIAMCVNILEDQLYTYCVCVCVCRD